MEVHDAVVSQKHYLCWYIIASSWFTDVFLTGPKLPNLIIEDRVKTSVKKLSGIKVNTVIWIWNVS